MLFVNKFWSHLNHYSITHDTPDLAFKIIYLFNMNPINLCLLKINNQKKFEICSQLTIKTLGRRHWHLSSVFILNLEQLSHLILVFQLLTLNRHFFVGTDNITNKVSQKKYFLLFNFAVTKICVVIRLGEDGTRMGGIQVQLSPSYIFYMQLCFSLSVLLFLESEFSYHSSLTMLTWKNFCFTEKFIES